MPKLILRLRTHHDLREILATGESPAWRIAQEKVDQITDVEIVAFDGKQMIEGVFDRNASYRREDDGRVVVKFLDGRIVNGHSQFPSRNPVQYLEECDQAPESATRVPNLHKGAIEVSDDFDELPTM